MPVLVPTQPQLTPAPGFSPALPLGCDIQWGPHPQTSPSSPPVLPEVHVPLQGQTEDIG